MIPGRSQSSAKFSGVHLNEMRCGTISMAATTNSLPSTLKHKSAPHCTISVVCGKRRQYCRIASMSIRSSLRGGCELRPLAHHHDFGVGHAKTPPLHVALRAAARMRAHHSILAARPGSFPQAASDQGALHAAPLKLRQCCGPVLRLWGHYQSSCLLALPGVLNIHERNTLRLHTKLPAGSMRHDFLQGINQHVARRNPGSPHNCQRCATQHGSGERYRRSGAFPDLNETGLRRDDGKLPACYRSQKCLCRAAPHVIDDDLETGISSLTDERLAEVLRRRVELNGRVSTEIM